MCITVFKYKINIDLPLSGCVSFSWGYALHRYEVGYGYDCLVFVGGGVFCGCMNGVGLNSTF